MQNTLFSLPIYRNSIKQENRNPKKIYAIDNGFKKIYDYAISEDMSKLYENIVFLHLRRQSQDIYYYKIKQEVDFYARIEGQEYLVNVSYQIHDERTQKREIEGLIEAMEYFNLHEAYLVTHSEDSKVEVNGKIIHIQPLYKFLLSGFKS